MVSMQKITVFGLAVCLMVGLPMITHKAYASGGGGGGGGGGSVGGGSTGGSSAPQYDPVVEYKKGVEAYKAGEYSKAVRAFRKVLKVASKDANTNELLAMSYEKLDKHKDAAKYYSKAVRYDDSKIGLYAKSAGAYMAADKAKKANAVLATLDKRIAICGDCSDKTALATARTDVAAAIAGTAVQKDSFLMPKTQMFAETNYFQAVGLINQARYTDAIAELKTMAVNIGPHPDVLNYLGYTHRKTGQFAKAEAYYLTALAVDPNHLGANEYLGELYVQTGQMDKARTQLAKLEKLCSFGCIQETELRGWIINAAP